jgi:hypothetical protein
MKDAYKRGVEKLLSPTVFSHPGDVYLVKINNF